MTKRPSFFLSSTIYDFRDLRSAIKFTLEARGCRVLASEFNDFGSNLDQHSYEACLTNIAQADYFILLVGGRVGGWYDEPNRISITQQEYRTAYERHKKGLIRIVTLVRAEVWQLREDRKALARHLSKIDMTENERNLIGNFPSKFATDSEFISQFLTEIGRNAETGDAVKKGTPKPTGNWIHVFHDFRDVHDALHPLAFSGLTADEAAYAKALQHELLVVLGRLLVKHNDKVIDVSQRLREHLNQCPIDKTVPIDGVFSIDCGKWRNFSGLFIQIIGIKFTPVVIEDAITSSIFLTYDFDTGTYIQSPSYNALFKLVEEIRIFNSMNTTEVLKTVFEYSPKNIGRPIGNINLPTQQLALLYGLAHRWINIINLSMALVLHLEGKSFEMPELMPLSPIRGMDEEIEKERVSAADARTALGL